MDQDTIRHPALDMPFDTLAEGLERECEAGNVYSRTDVASGRTLYCYTKACVYSRAWNEFNMLARGLILDLGERRVVATPFPKFFNWSEGRVEVPNLPFEAFEKMDGSLAIIHHDGTGWRAATKGSLDSSQALWTERLLARSSTSPLVPGTTYLAEAIYPENRIVIPYSHEGLTLLGAYHADGYEADARELAEVAAAMGWRLPKVSRFSSMEELLRHAHGLPVTEEGFVIRFSNGLRIKVKGNEYCRVHAMIARCTPLAMWDAMVAGDSLPEIRKVLPEEFWEDFDNIVRLLKEAMNNRFDEIAVAAEGVRDLSDKELGLSGAVSPSMKGMVYAYRKNGGCLEGRIREGILRSVRPGGNVLPGYRPSYAMQRVEDEAG